MRSKWMRSFFTLVVFAATPGFLTAAEASTGQTLNLISATPIGTPGNGASYNRWVGSSHYPSAPPAVSADGRYVAFTSTATNLVSGQNADGAVYLRDTLTGQTRAVSMSPDGATVRGDGVGMSADGTRIVFLSSANTLVPGDRSNTMDVFVVDTSTRIIQRVNRTSSGTPSQEGFSNDDAGISSDGGFVAFRNLDSPIGPSGIYIKSLATGALTRVATCVCSNPHVTRGGHYVVFETADALVGWDLNQKVDVYRHDMDTGMNLLVSVDSNGIQPLGLSSGDSADPSVSDDGNLVAFSSGVKYGVTDSNNVDDVYLRDVSTQTTRRISVSDNGSQLGYNSKHPFIAPSGRYIAFDTEAPAVEADSNRKSDIYVRDVGLGKTQLVSTPGQLALGNGDSYSPSLTSDGSVVSFVSSAANFDGGPDNGASDIFQYLWHPETDPPNLGALSANPTTFSPGTSSNEATTTLTATITDPSPGSPPIAWSILITNSAGSPVKQYNAAVPLSAANPLTIPGQVWDGTDDIGAPVADGAYTATFFAQDKWGNRATPSAINVTIDRVSPVVGNLTPRDGGNTNFISQPLMAQLDDGVGIDPSNITFSLTDDAGTAPTVDDVVSLFSGGDVSYDPTSRWARTRSLSLSVGHNYSFSVTIRDLAGNSAFAGERTLAVGGGFYVMQASSVPTVVTIPRTSCQLGAAQQGANTRLATCTGVPVFVPGSTATVTGSKHNGKYALISSFDVSQIRLVTSVNGVDIFQAGNAAWGTKGVEIEFPVVASTVSQSLISQPQTGELATLTADVPAAWTSVAVMLDPLAGSPVTTACADPGSAQNCDPDPVQTPRLNAATPPINAAHTAACDAALSHTQTLRRTPFADSTLALQVDTSKVAVDQVQLKYSLNGGPFSVVTQQGSGAAAYSFTVPAQLLLPGTLIEYAFQVSGTGALVGCRDISTFASPRLMSYQSIATTDSNSDAVYEVALDAMMVTLSQPAYVGQSPTPVTQACAAMFSAPTPCDVFPATTKAGTNDLRRGAGQAVSLTMADATSSSDPAISYCLYNTNGFNWAYRAYTPEDSLSTEILGQAGGISPGDKQATTETNNCFGPGESPSWAPNPNDPNGYCPIVIGQHSWISGAFSFSGAVHATAQNGFLVKVNNSDLATGRTNQVSIDIYYQTTGSSKARLDASASPSYAAAFATCQTVITTCSAGYGYYNLSLRMYDDINDPTWMTNIANANQDSGLMYHGARKSRSDFTSLLGKVLSGLSFIKDIFSPPEDYYYPDGGGLSHYVFNGDLPNNRQLAVMLNMTTVDGLEVAGVTGARADSDFRVVSGAQAGIEYGKSFSVLGQGFTVKGFKISPRSSQYKITSCTSSPLTTR